MTQALSILAGGISIALLFHGWPQIIIKQKCNCKNKKNEKEIEQKE